MNNTRERILNAALHCFAQNGYEAASISDIALQLGISKGALYRHFSNKRAILDAIIVRMEQQDAERACEYDVPEEEFSSGSEAYRQTDPEAICRFAIAQFHYWTEDPFAADFRRLLALERYHDAEMMRLYQNYLCAGPLGYMEDLFREIGNPQQDARALAMEFYGVMYLLMDAADAMPDKCSAVQQLEKTMVCFIKDHFEKGDQHAIHQEPKISG